jgi:formylglycine-generating enzyme required for sulfatase activity
MKRSELIVRVRRLLENNQTEAAINALILYAGEADTSARTALTLLKSRFTRNEDLFQGPAGRRISRDDYEQELANITYSLTELFDELPEEQEVPLSLFEQFDSPNNKPSSRKQGKILYHIPAEMTRGNRSRCVIRISPEEVADAILTKDISDQPLRDVEPVRIAKMMKVVLEDLPGESNFEVGLLSEHVEQPILEEEVTEWIYTVKPLKSGQFSLVLKVSISEIIDSYGERWKDVVVLDREIRVLAEGQPPASPKPGAEAFSVVPGLRVASAGATPRVPNPGPETAGALPESEAVQPANMQPQNSHKKSQPARSFWQRLLPIGILAVALVIVSSVVFRLGIPSQSGDLPEGVFADVPVGRFRMGNASGPADEQPVHIVTLDSFSIGKYEVTVAEFRFFAEESGYVTDAEKAGGSNVAPDLSFRKGVNWRCGPTGELRPASEDKHPVVHISWNDATAYCAWLSKRSGHTCRLPTEAEWEYAARGGQWEDKPSMNYSGSRRPEDVAWFIENSSSYTQPVGRKLPNRLGIYDLSGNVWEWCSDLYGPYPESEVHNPKGATDGDKRIGKGGGFSGTRDQLVLTRRFPSDPGYSDMATGFRVVREK